MRKTIFSIIFLSILSCNSGSNKQIEIRNDFKIKTLAQILELTEEIGYSFDKNQDMVSNYPRMTSIIPTYYDSIENKLKLYNTNLEWYSESLNEKDTSFIKQQFIDNKNLDLDKLSEYGYRMVDIRKFHNLNYSQNRIDSIVNEHYKKLGINDTVTYSKSYLIIDYPIFNKQMNKVIIRSSVGSGGNTLIFTMKDNKWELKDEISNWVE